MGVILVNLAVTIGLVVSVVGLGSGGLVTYVSMEKDITENHTLIEANTITDNERQENLKDDLDELKESDKEIQRLLRELIRQTQ